MQRRNFIVLTAQVSSLIVAGQLPLLAADPEKKLIRLKRNTVSPVSGRSRNIFTDPPAIEPITGYMPGFLPVSYGSMTGSFTAEYDLVKWANINDRNGKARNIIAGSLTIERKVRGQNSVYMIEELRYGQTKNRLTFSMDCHGKLNIATKWKLKSVIEAGTITAAQPDITYTEIGYAKDGNIVQESSLAKLSSVSTRALIPQEAIPNLLANGIAKEADINFDMLQNGNVIKTGQTLHYSGTVTVPIAKGTATMDCYSHTGYGILPTHYLVDSQGLTQLITQENTNWALKSIS